MQLSLPDLLVVLALLPLAIASPFADAAGPNVQARGRVATIPINKRDKAVRNGVVNIEGLRSQLDRATAKVLRGFERYRINTGSRHPLQPDVDVDLSTTDFRRDTGTAPLIDINEELLWQGDITVGTPAVKFTVDFDTGSSDFFLPAASCGSTCDGHTKYNPSASTSSIVGGKAFTLTYGDGSNVSGSTYGDSVTVAGLTAKNQTVGAATRYSSGFAATRFPPDGLVGLGYTSLSVWNAPAIHETLADQGLLTEKVLAFKLAKTGSELNIGGLNKASYTGDITYAPVTKQAYWQINFDSLQVDSKTIVNTTTTIVDSGTTLIIGAPAGIRAFYAAIPGAKDAASLLGTGFFTIPCNTTLPSVTFTIAGRAFTMDPSTLNYGAVEEGSNECIGTLAYSTRIGSLFWILGDAFMRNTYTIFDWDQHRVGFAQVA